MQRTVLVILAMSFAPLAACANEAGPEPRAPGSDFAEKTSTSSPGRAAEPIALGRRYAFDERWSLTDPKARKDLEGTKFGEQEIKEFWTRKGWRLTEREEQYFAKTEQLYKEGQLTIVSRWYQVPYSPVYQTLEPVTLLGVTIPPQTEFWLEPCENADKVFMGNPRFARGEKYSEEHEGHFDGQAGKRQDEAHAKKRDDD